MTCVDACWRQVPVFHYSGAILAALGHSGALIVAYTAFIIRVGYARTRRAEEHLERRPKESKRESGRYGGMGGEGERESGRAGAPPPSSHSLGSPVSSVALPVSYLNPTCPLSLPLSLVFFVPLFLSLPSFLSSFPSSPLNLSGATGFCSVRYCKWQVHSFAHKLTRCRIIN